MDSATIARVAEYYRNAQHTPNHPSYQSFIRETLAQWDALVAHGWRFSLVSGLTPGPETYADSNAMFQDIARKQLRVDTAGQDFAPGHPLANVVYGSVWHGEYWTANEVFRAVHDVNGHGTSLCPFETFQGELEAIRNHSRMYSVESWPALFGETFGQLCHYLAGYGFVKIQRAVVLPMELINLALPEEL
ncbi:MAG TPA: hypothetical protein VIY48_05960 [Candidatus Paceibacterota bacterium]